MSLTNLRKQVMGSYNCNAFCINLDEDVHIFERGVKKPSFTQISDFSVFTHEYWHYLINMSTVAGFKSFRTYQSLLSLFSNTLMKYANGVADCDSLEESDREVVDSLIKLIKVEEGSTLPEGLHERASVKKFSIVNVSESDCKIYLEGKKVPTRQVVLELRIDLGTVIIPKNFNLGTTAIDEGIAHEIESFIRSENDTTEQSPFFPYTILRKLSEYFTERSLSSYEICALASMAMLTVEPAKALITILPFYKEFLDKNYSSEDALKAIWEGLKPQFEECIHEIDSECSDLAQIHKGRGLIEYAIDYVNTKYIEMLNRRLENPLFDLEPFKENNCDISKINVMLNDIIPCDTIQQETGDDDDVCKDQLLSFGNQEEWKGTGYRPTDFLRALQCQTHYLLSHISSSGFKSSCQVSQKCPFYTICDQDIRKTNGEICKRNPWKVTNDCWYGASVKSTIGTVDVIGKRNITTQIL